MATTLKQKSKIMRHYAGADCMSEAMERAAECIEAMAREAAVGGFCSLFQYQTGGLSIGEWIDKHWPDSVPAEYRDLILEAEEGTDQWNTS